MESSSNSSSEQDTATTSVTFRFTVADITRLREPALSPPVLLRGVPWRLEVARYRVGDQNFLSVRLCCNPTQSTDWSCKAAFDLVLLSQRPEVSPNIRVTFRNEPIEFSNKEWNHGCSYVILWADMLDPKNNYLKDDSITVEAAVSAQAPEGIAQTDS